MCKRPKKPPPPYMRKEWMENRLRKPHESNQLFAPISAPLLWVLILDALGSDSSLGFYLLSKEMAEKLFVSQTHVIAPSWNSSSQSFFFFTGSSQTSLNLFPILEDSIRTGNQMAFFCWRLQRLFCWNKDGLCGGY